MTLRPPFFSYVQKQLIEIQEKKITSMAKINR